MATGSWQAGFNKSVTFGGVSLKILESSWVPKIMQLIVTHSQSGGVEGWIAGILSGSGETKANVDALNVPPSLNIVPGALGFMIFSIGSGIPFIIPIGILEVHYATVVSGLVTYSFSHALNSEVGAYSNAA